MILALCLPGLFIPEKRFKPELVFSVWLPKNFIKPKVDKNDMMENNKWRTGWIRLPLVLLSMMTLMILTGCRDLLEDEFPGWLGSSIYDNLNNDGNFENMAKLIVDLDYKEILAKTGSKTLFVADDDAFDKFYSHNDWGVNKYEELTLAQKKMLLFGSMINNSYQLNTLSSSEGPTIGGCMRRLTSLTIYDSVPIIEAAEMPDNIYWQRFRTANRKILCMKDMSQTPMIHFIETQLNRNNITNDDYDFLMNYTTSRKAGDASINGISVVAENIKCSNGFVHEMNDVMLPLKNMAEIIRAKETTNQYSQLIERFCAPYYNVTATNEYNRLYNASVDSVFQKRYFSDRSQGGSSLVLTPDNKAVNGTLKFDPGWNTYFPSTAVSTSSEKAMQQDMAVMLVPSDDAMKDYWDNGAGKVLKDYYGTWEEVPDKIISKLINNNMLNQFQSSVPSKFGSILDDALNEMEIDVDDVDSVYLGCNGAIYLTNKVFSPTAYVSVAFPALVNPSMWIINWAIEQLSYDAYLNALKATYSFFIPNNSAMLNYIDPVSYGKSQTQKFKFWYDSNETSESLKVKASVFNYDLNTGQEDSVREASYSEIINRLEDILETHTVIGNVEDGNSYYRTKGGSTLMVANTSSGVNGMTVSGSHQIDMGNSVPVTKVYSQKNGKAYILEQEPIMTTRNSVYDILSAHPEFAKFKELLDGDDTGYLTSDMNGHASPSLNIEFFSRYHYTVYVPSEAAINELQTAGKLPTWDEVKAETDSTVKERKAEIIRNFVKYHIQDNSIFVDKKSVNGSYQTAVMNDKLKVFYTVTLSGSDDALTVTDLLSQAHPVTTDPTLRNLIAREYQYDTDDKLKATTIFSSAQAVVHLIEGAMEYDSKQFDL
jgi:hypothetical protein